eukprot:141352-Rhodomonas_salina.4
MSVLCASYRLTPIEYWAVSPYTTSLAVGVGVRHLVCERLVVTHNDVSTANRRSAIQEERVVPAPRSSCPGSAIRASQYRASREPVGFRLPGRGCKLGSGPHVRLEHARCLRRRDFLLPRVTRQGVSAERTGVSVSVGRRA